MCFLSDHDFIRFWYRTLSLFFDFELFFYLWLSVIGGEVVYKPFSMWESFIALTWFRCPGKVNSKMLLLVWTLGRDWCMLISPFVPCKHLVATYKSIFFFLNFKNIHIDWGSNFPSAPLIQLYSSFQLPSHTSTFFWSFPFSSIVFSYFITSVFYIMPSIPKISNMVCSFYLFFVSNLCKFLRTENLLASSLIFFVFEKQIQTATK